jgi:hypothetical protein
VAGVLVAVAVATATLASLDAAAGPVKGRLTGQDKLLPEVYVEAAKPDMHRFTWREPSPSVRAEFRALTANLSRDVCVAALGQGAGPPGEPRLIRVTGGHTVPTTIVVTPGTRLSFENRDPFTHRLYAVGVAAWKAENQASGARREWGAPPGQGRYEFRDELTPSLRFYVNVEPNVADIAYPGRDGAFAMRDLPGGEYTLQAFFNGKKVGRGMSVTAKDRLLVDIKELPVGEGGSAP